MLLVGGRNNRGLRHAGLSVSRLLRGNDREIGVAI
jgi:hypothetical protein